MKKHEITLERALVPRAEPGELEKSPDAGSNVIQRLADGLDSWR
jgi:hypothetical protein